MRVADCMTSKAATISPADTCEEALKRMQRSGMGCLAVVHAGRLVGIISAEQIYQRTQPIDGPEGTKRPQHAPSRLKVGGLMTYCPITISSSAPLQEAALIMRRERLSQLVVASGSRPVGILTMADVVSALARLLKEFPDTEPE